MISPILNSPAALAYLERIGATMRSLFGASISTQSMRYEKVSANIRFSRSGSVSCPPELTPTSAEAEAIRQEVSALRFPTQVRLKALPNSELPDLIKNAKHSDLYIFRDASKQIRFLQVRVDLDNGDKRYVPQTYWSDGQWRAAEPEEGLPIYNLDLAYHGARVFLHEGAKAARAAQEIAEDGNHPWSEYLSTGVHLGWIGGAHHLQRNLWRELTPLPGELIIMPDNDFISKVTVSKISRKFACPTYFCQLDARWPSAWDVADPLPGSFFSAETELYQGPELQDLLVSCNWATEEVEVEGANRPIYVIREEFAQNWVRIQNLKHYANIHYPEVTLDRDQFNTKVQPYSNVSDTANLLAKVSGNICDKVTFMPNLPTGIVSLDGDLCLNQYVDRRMKPLNSNSAPSTAAFWKFMEYMLPDAEERRQVVRWIATLYAQPSTRMGYGLLLLSKLQGVGKSTLLDIIASLIGRRHVSFPGDAMIQSDFNGWVVNKRLVVVHEIYAGQNWKAYNRLKSLITDQFVEANNKHMVNYTLPNWSHFAAASNSLEALRVEHDDRRWYVPRLASDLYEDYNSVYAFIRSGGLRSLAGELLEFGDYVKPGEHAPLTASKLALIDQSMPPDERMTLMLCERMPVDACLDLKDIWLWLQTEVRGRAYITPQRIGSLLKEKGHAVELGIQVGSRLRDLVWHGPDALKAAVEGLTGDALQKRVAERLREPGQIFQSEASM